uniref:Uncharacterized protein n=1 Tax=Acrobeloides nanus TaxID=290746 RepID=A0A914CJ57_9BILA
MKQYVNRRFNKNYKATVGVDFFCKDIKIDDHVVTMQIYDTAGQERFRSLNAAFYRGADCCVLVYDITEESSFKSVEVWRKDCLFWTNLHDPDKLPCVLLGNKLDLARNRIVYPRRAEEWCDNKKNKIPYFEVSAKDSTGLDEAFEAIARISLQNNSLEVIDPSEFPLIQIQPNKKSIDCCQNN